MGKPEYQFAQGTQKLSYIYMECMESMHGLFATAYATELAHGGDPAKVV